MSRFDSADAFYATFGSFVQRITESPGFGSAILKASTPVQLEFSDPSATIVVRPAGQNLEVAFDRQDPSISAVMTMSAETAHVLMLGEKTFQGAIGRGELHYSREVEIFLPLLPALSFAVFPRYRDHLEDLGREDLL